MGHFLNTGIYTLSLSKDQENYSLLFFCPMGPNQLTITPPFNSHCNPQYKSDQFPQPGYGRDRLRFSPPKTFQTTSSSFSGGHLQHKAVMNQLYSPFPWLKMLYCIKINQDALEQQKQKMRVILHPGVQDHHRKGRFSSSRFSPAVTFCFCILSSVCFR